MHTGLTVDQLLEAIQGLSDSERREFTRRLKQDQNEKGDARVEATLIESTQSRLPVADERRLQQLIEKSEQGALTRRELTEYRVLATRAEQLDVKRVEALAELTRRWGKPVREVMAAIGWKETDLDTPSRSARRAKAGARARS